MFKLNRITAATVEGFQSMKEAGEMFCKYVWPEENRDIQIDISPNIIGVDIKPTYTSKDVFFRVFDGLNGTPEDRSAAKLDTLHFRLTEDYAYISLNKNNYCFYYKAPKKS